MLAAQTHHVFRVVGSVIAFLVGALMCGCATAPANILGSVVEDDPLATTSDYCEPVTDWPAEFGVFEAEVLALINEYRASGADCAEGGLFDPASPLTMNSALRCAARLHSLDMYSRGFFNHTNPEGEGPIERTTAAGYEGSGWGENIAAGYTTPEAVMAGWMDSPGHCANIMRANYTEVGVGYAEGNHWTLNFGAP